jgi:phospholipid transport system substrate-binding protein
MRKIILLILISISLFAIEKENIINIMENKINKATSIIAQKDLMPQEKAKKIFPLFDDIFDYKLMTKLSLGKANWIKMSTEQREEFTTEFIKYLKNSYIEKISLYTDEKLHIIGLKELNKKRVLLLTQLVGSKDTYDITYKFYKSKNNNWLIYDVDIIGISLIKIYRVQFKNILEKESYDTLLAKIKTK